MTTIGAQLLGTESGGTVLLEVDGAVLLETGDALNTEAETRALSGNEICSKSGMKAYPGEMVVDEYTLELVLKRYKDPDQQIPRSFRSESGTGPVRGEQTDTFISVAITIDDL